MAVLKADFYAVPEGEIYPRLFKAGETVDGLLEQAARDQGKAEHPKPQHQKPSRKAHKSAPEKK